MELYQLRTFITVARTKHLTRAAEQLATSQPAVSAQIKALEEEFALSLFTRTAKGMVLTPAGTDLLAQAEKVLLESERLSHRVKTLQKELVGGVRIGLNEDGTYLRIEQLCNLAATQYSRLKIQILSSSSHIILQDIEEGRLECGYIFGEYNEDKIDGVRLCSQRIMVTAPAGWQERILGAGWQELLQLPWAWQTPSCPYKRGAMRFFTTMGLAPPESVFSADQDATILNIVASGCSLGLVKEPDALQAARQGKVVVWDGGCLELELFFVWKRERREDPLIQAVVRMVRQIWGVAEPSPENGEPSGAAPMIPENCPASLRNQQSSP